jgi:hypothetical protein
MGMGIEKEMPSRGFDTTYHDEMPWECHRGEAILINNTRHNTTNRKRCTLRNFTEKK